MESIRDEENSSSRLKHNLCHLSNAEPANQNESVFHDACTGLSPSSSSFDKDSCHKDLQETTYWNLDQQQTISYRSYQPSCRSLDPTRSMTDKQEPSSSSSDSKEPTFCITNQQKLTSYSNDQQEPISYSNAQQEPARYSIDQQDPTSYNLDQQEPTSYSIDQQEPTSYNLDQQEPTSYSIDQQEPTSYNLDQQEPTSYSIDQQEPTSYSIDQQEPTSYSIDQQESTSYSIDQQKPTSYSIDQQESISYNRDQQEPTTYSIDQQEPTSYSVDQQEPTSYNIDQQEPTTYSIDQQEPTSYSIDQQEPTRYSIDQREPTSSSSDHQEPTSCSSDKQEPTSCSIDQQEPTGCISDQQEPTSCSIAQQEPTSCRSDHQEPTSCSSDQQEPTSCSSDQQEPTGCISDQQEPTSCSSDQQEPTSCRSDHQEPTSCSSDQQEPNSYNRDQQEPTSYSIDQQEPIRYNIDQQEPTSCSSDQQEPNSFSSDQQEPTSCSSDQQEPTSCSSDHQEPTSCSRDEQEPTSCSSDQQEPNSCSSDEQEPTSCSIDQQESFSYQQDPFIYQQKPTSSSSNHQEPFSCKSNEEEPLSCETDQEEVSSSCSNQKGPFSCRSNQKEPYDHFSYQQEPERYTNRHQELDSCPYSHFIQNRQNGEKQELFTSNINQQAKDHMDSSEGYSHSLILDVTSPKYQSSHVDSFSGFWDSDSNMSLYCNSITSDASQSCVKRSDFSESILTEGTQAGASSLTSWRGTSDGCLDSDLLPLDHSGCNWYSQELAPELNQSLFTNVPSYTNTPQRFGQNSSESFSSCSQHSAPTLRIPDLSQFNVEPNEKQLSPTEEQFAQFQTSALNFLNNILSLELSKEATQEISLETELPNKGCLSPTEFLNSPNGLSQFSTATNVSSEGQSLPNQGQDFSSRLRNSSPMVSSGPDPNDVWQQFIVEPDNGKQQTKNIENQRNFENMFNYHQTNFSDSGFSDSVQAMQQFTPIPNVSRAPSPVSTNTTQESFSFSQSQGNLIDDYVAGQEYFNSPYTYRLNQNSSTDSLDTRLSDSNTILSSNCSINTPSHSGVVVGNGNEPCYPQQSTPIVSPTQFQGKYTHMLCRQLDSSPFQQMSTNVSFPQQLPQHMDTRPQISGPRDQISFVNNGNIMSPRPQDVNAWNEIHQSAQMYNSATCQSFYRYRPTVNSQMEANRDSQMFTQMESSGNMEDSELKAPVALLPVPEHFVMPAYSCQVEQYARNYPRYTAIQPYFSDGPCHSLCSERNMKCFPQKHGAVSIKTKEGKFLCMASDFHTKTVREILDSAETCKERADAAKKDEITKMDEADKDSDGNRDMPGDCCNVGEDDDHCSADTNIEDEIICVTDSESQDTCSNDGPNNMLGRPSFLQHRNEWYADKPVNAKPDANKELSVQNLFQQQCNSLSPKVDGEVDVLITDDGENPSKISQSSPQEQNAPVSEFQRTLQPGTNPIQPLCKTPTMARSASPTVSASHPPAVSASLPPTVAESLPPTVSASLSPTVAGNLAPPTVYANDLVPLNSSSIDSHRQSHFIHAYPGKELLYRGTVNLNHPFIPKQSHPPTYLGDLPPAQDHHPDRAQHLVFNPGCGPGYYGPMLPSREVQLSTAQPYPLLPSMFHGPSYPPISHPFFVPHAPSYHSGYDFVNPSSLNRGLPVDVGTYGLHHNTNHPDDGKRGWPEKQGDRDRPGIHFNYPQTSYQFDGRSSSTSVGSSITPSNFVFSKKLQEQRESMNKIAFKPKHFEFTSLQIGSYRYSSDVAENKTAKIKLLYSKKKIVYEFQLNAVKEMYEHNQRKLALVEIPFGGIVQLSGKGQEFKIEVSVPPKVYQGEQLLKKECKFGVHANAKFKRCEEDDMTDGEIHHIPYHYIQLKGNQLDKLTHYLQLYDERFEMLLHLSFVEEHGKLLDPPEKTIRMTPVTMEKMPSTNPVIDKEESSSRPAILKRNREMFGGCHCQTGCKTGRCSCSRSLKACCSLCQCSNCANLFNTLNNHKITTKAAREDSCLLHNLFKVVDLRRFLKTEVTLPCCHLTVSIRQCIPGETRCPNYPRCLARYQFSWCSGTLCDQAKSPRNHCKICKSCCGKQYRHCGSCNRCYFAGFSGFSCPTCNATNVRLRENQRMYTLSDAEIIRNILPT